MHYRQLHKAQLLAGHGAEECCSQHEDTAMIKTGKPETPLSKDQGRGAANKGSKNMTEFDNVLRSISSQGILGPG